MDQVAIFFNGEHIGKIEKEEADKNNINNLANRGLMLLNVKAFIKFGLRNEETLKFVSQLSHKLSTTISGGVDKLGYLLHGTKPRSYYNPNLIYIIGAKYNFKEVYDKTNIINIIDDKDFVNTYEETLNSIGSLDQWKNIEPQFRKILEWFRKQEEQEKQHRQEHLRQQQQQQRQRPTYNNYSW